MAGDAGAFISALGLDRVDILGHSMGDIVIATVNSFILQQNIPDSRLVLYPDSNHGAHYQFHDDFVAQVELFLRQVDAIPLDTRTGPRTLHE